MLKEIRRIILLNFYRECYHSAVVKKFRLAVDKEDCRRMNIYIRYFLQKTEKYKKK